MKKSSLKTGLTFALCGFLLYLGIHYWPRIGSFLSTLLSAATPLFIGIVIAYVINIVMGSFEKWFFPGSKKKWIKKIRRPVSLLLAILVLSAVIALVIWLVVPQFISCIQLMIQMIPDAMTRLTDLIAEKNLLSDEVLATLKGIDWNSRMEQLLNMVTTGVTGVANILISTVTSLVSGLVTALFSLIFALYLLLGKDKIKGQTRRVLSLFLPEKAYRGVRYVWGHLNDSFRRYLIGQSTEAVILGLLCGLGMVCLRLPYAAMISALVAFTALIPIAGAYIGAFVGAFMILTVSPMKSLVFLIFLAILQQVEGNLIYPRVVGSSLGLPGIWVLLAITLGGGIAGILGMFLGVPLAAAIYRMVRDAARQKEIQKSAALKE